MICPRCNTRPSRPSHRYCTECHAKNMREWRKTHKLEGVAKKKDIARSYAGVYLREGKIEKKPCEVCGDPNAQMHHDDYDKPIDIRWLCRTHHVEHHRKEPTRRNNLTLKGVTT